MEKKLQDYLHYYLGCDCWEEYNNKVGKLVSVNSFGEVKIAHQTLWTFSYKEVKPILRRLEDMTEEEGVNMFGTDRYWDIVCKEGKWDAFSSNEFHALIQHHFDQFGLIDAGLAIDAKTI